MSSKPSSSWIKWLVLLAVVGGGGYAGYRRWAAPKAAPLEYQTATVTRGDVIQVVTANGSLSPVRMVEVGSQISGVITDIKVDFNSRVKAGEVIAQIDPASYERSLGEADAQLANSEAALELAQLEFNRATELLASKLISKSEYDASRVNLGQAKANVKIRQANVERAKVDLGRTTIYAPMDGIVITRKVEVGQTVAASMNAPILLVIANDLAKMQIEAAVSEADVGGVEEGQTVEFTVDAFPGRRFQGEVQQVRYAPTTNQSVITYTTVVEVENKDLKLRPGMTANARIITAARRGVPKLPNSAVRFRPPTGAVVKGDTNEPAAAAATATVALIESGPFAGLPVMPWMASGERRTPTDSERSAYAASLTPEQKQKYEKARAEMRARMAQAGGPGGAGGGGSGGGGFGGGGGGSGERRRTDSEGPKTGTVYVIEKEPLSIGGERTVLRPITVKLGIGDGTSVEVVDGLKEGEVVAIGTVSITPDASTGPRNPLGNPFGGPGRRR